MALRRCLVGCAVISIMLLVSCALSGCGSGHSGSLGEDKDGGKFDGHVAVSGLSFPMYRKTKTDETASVSSDAGDRVFDWMVKTDNTWSEKQTDDFIAAAEKAGFTIAAHGRKINFLMLEISAPFEKLTKFLADYQGIDFVEESVTTSMISPSEIASVETDTQTNAPWGLDRIDESYLGLDGSYTSGHGAGAGVHVYVLDTGIKTTHSDFEGRAIPTLDMCGQGTTCQAVEKVCDAHDTTCAIDRHGHGTHCAGIVGGNRYGVAKEVTLHAVKILDDEGNGPNVAGIAAILWIIENAIQPAVISMSLGSAGVSRMYSDAVDSAFWAGIPVVVAAGNSDINACEVSPAFVPNAITVGATDKNDARAIFASGASNWGSCVDILAPGKDIQSLGINSDTSSMTLSGTSMACPHVAGVAALLRAEDRSRSPEQISSKILALASEDKISGLKGEPNRLLFVGTGCEYDVCSQDACAGTIFNSIPWGEQWEVNESDNGRSCCFGGFGSCSTCCEPPRGPDQCEDTIGWTNSAGHTCVAYATEWCRGGTFWGIGWFHNYPNKNCCACGKGKDSR